MPLFAEAIAAKAEMGIWPSYYLFLPEPTYAVACYGVVDWVSLKAVGYTPKQIGVFTAYENRYVLNRRGST